MSTKRATKLAWIASMMLAAACAPVHVAIRASSAGQLTQPDSSVHIARPADAVLEQVKASLDLRGYHLSGQYPAKDGSRDQLYLFKGRREAVVVGAVTTVGRSVVGETASFQFGSVYYVRLHGSGAETDVLVLGKPTLQGQELCSDADVWLKAFEYWCKDSSLSNGGKLMPYLSGKEEADVVRGVLLELKQKLGAPAAVPQ
jgi:hypothetical protein